MAYDWDDRDRGRYGRGSGSGYGRDERRGGRGWTDQVGDELRSWFGDDDAERRRRMDEARSGRGVEGDFAGRYRGGGDFGRESRDYGGDHDRGRRERGGFFGGGPGGFGGGGLGGYGSSGGFGGYQGERYGFGNDDNRRGGSRGDSGSSGWQGGRGGDDRGMMDRAGDALGSWLGEDDRDREYGGRHHRGRGPKGYTRSDDRIREDVSDRLSQDPHIDASDIEVSVSGGEVTLSGTVQRRFDKRHAEDLAERVSGVKHVQNNLRVSEVR